MSTISGGIAVTFAVSALFVIYASLLHSRGPFPLYSERGSIIILRLWSSFTCLPIMAFLISFEILMLCRPSFLNVGPALASLSLFTNIGSPEIIGISLSAHMLLLFVMYRLCESIAVADYVEKYELISAEISGGTFHRVGSLHERQQYEASITSTLRLVQMFIAEFIGFLTLISAMYLYMF